MWKMLQQDLPDDYVLATGVKSTVREFCSWCPNVHGFEMVWQGNGINEKGIDHVTGRVLIEIDEKFFKPAEVDLLFGDPSKAKNKIGWRAKTSAKELAELMAKSDYD